MSEPASAPRTADGQLRRGLESSLVCWTLITLGSITTQLISTNALVAAKQDPRVAQSVLATSALVTLGYRVLYSVLTAIIAAAALLMARGGAARWAQPLGVAALALAGAATMNAVALLGGDSTLRLGSYMVLRVLGIGALLFGVARVAEGRGVEVPSPLRVGTAAAFALDVALPVVGLGQSAWAQEYPWLLRALLLAPQLAVLVGYGFFVVLILRSLAPHPSQAPLLARRASAGDADRDSGSEAVTFLETDPRAAAISDSADARDSNPDSATARDSHPEVDAEADSISNSVADSDARADSGPPAGTLVDDGERHRALTQVAVALLVGFGAALLPLWDFFSDQRTVERLASQLYDLGASQDGTSPWVLLVSLLTLVVLPGLLRAMNQAPYRARMLFFVVAILGGGYALVSARGLALARSERVGAWPMCTAEARVVESSEDGIRGPRLADGRPCVYVSERPALMHGEREEVTLRDGILHIVARFPRDRVRFFGGTLLTLAALAWAGRLVFRLAE
ncbi:MAG: hypothetical protein R3B13_01255 [Polyangiaceae bacterium]